MDKQQRVDWVDYAKGIGIFLVVLGHVLGGLQERAILGDSYWYRFVETAFYSFHMPLFFFVAGLFVWRSARRSFGDFLTDKAGVIVYPYVVWSVLQGLLQFATSRYVNHAIDMSQLLSIPFIPIAQFWFLYTLFVILIVYRLFQSISASNLVFLGVAIACFVVEKSGADAIDWVVVHDVASSLIYFGAGVAVARSPVLARLAALRGGWLLAIAIAGYAAIAGSVAVYGEHEAALSPAPAAAGIVATVALAMLMSRATKFSFVKLWGVLSLEIYVGHVIAAAVMRIVLQRAFGVAGPLVHGILGTGVGLYAPILLAYTSRRLMIPYVFTFGRVRPGPWLRPAASPLRAEPMGASAADGLSKTAH